MSQEITLASIILKLPNTVRDDVTKVFSFRTLALEYAQTNKKAFTRLRARWLHIKDQLTEGIVASALDESREELALYNIAFIVHRYQCDPEWIDSCFDSLQRDIQLNVFETIDDTLRYVYGSAEVFGLCVARILQIPIRPYEPIRLQARAWQWMSFIQYAQIDASQGRSYFPQRSLVEYNLPNLSQKTAQLYPKRYSDFMAEQKSVALSWQSEACKALSYLPKPLQNTYQELQSTLTN